MLGTNPEPCAWEARALPLSYAQLQEAVLEPQGGDRACCPRPALWGLGPGTLRSGCHRHRSPGPSLAQGTSPPRVSQGWPFAPICVLVTPSSLQQMGIGPPGGLLSVLTSAPGGPGQASYTSQRGKGLRDLLLEDLSLPEHRPRMPTSPLPTPDLPVLQLWQCLHLRPRPVTRGGPQLCGCPHPPPASPPGQKVENPRAREPLAG